MSVILILASTLMLSDTTNLVSGSFLEGWRGFRNSFFDQAIIIEGSKAEEIYLTEQSNQTDELQALKKKNAELEEKFQSGQKSPSDKDIRILNSFSAEAYKLDQESREKDFCEEENVCPRAFKNTFFSQKGFKRNWEPGKTMCVDKKITASKGGRSLTTNDRRLVQCDITSTSGISKVFLVPSTKYEPEKNLQFFALIEESGTAKPIAYLMNKKEDKPKFRRTGSAKLRQIATHSTASGVLGSVTDSLRYTWMYPRPYLDLGI